MSSADQDAQVPATGSTEAIPAQTKDAPGPDSPLQLGETGWRDTFKRAGKEFVTDRCRP